MIILIIYIPKDFIMRSGFGISLVTAMFLMATQEVMATDVNSWAGLRTELIKPTTETINLTGSRSIQR